MARRPQPRRKAVAWPRVPLRDDEAIPQRPVMYGQEIRGLVGATVGRPGVGKTKLIVTEALAKASGRQLLHDLPTGQFNCWCWFGEEVQEDLDRLLTAAMNFHGLRQGDIARRLFISSRAQKLIVAKPTPATGWSSRGPKSKR